jgi:hypothetical protein
VHCAAPAPDAGRCRVTAVWIGVDPGARRTGIAMRNGTTLLGWRLIERATDEGETGAGPTYWADIHDAIRGLAITAPGDWRLAIEGVRAPGGFRDGKRQFAHPRDLIALAATYGAILDHHPGAVTVPPGAHGRGALTAYPTALITAAERRLGVNRAAGDSAPISHVRSAWDVAGMGPRIARQRIVARTEGATP